MDFGVKYDPDRFLDSFTQWLSIKQFNVGVRLQFLKFHYLSLSFSLL